jgi:hypothetical protein
MSDLSSLFPDLPADILRDFETSNSDALAHSPNSLQIDGERSTVTDDQVADYLRSVGSLRAPLRPVVSGQQPTAIPEYVAGRGNPAPDPNASYVEAPDAGDGSPPEPSPEQPPRATETTPLPTTAPLAPPAPLAPLERVQEPIPPPPDLPPPYPPAAERPPPVEIPTSQPAPDPSLKYLADLLDSDPNLRNVIAAYLTTGQVPASPAAPPRAVAPPPTYTPIPPAQSAQPLPPVSAQPAPQRYPELDYDDPSASHIRQLYDQNAAIQQRLDDIARNQKFSDDAAQQQQARHYESIVEGVVSKFGADYSLPAHVLQNVRETAARLGAANSYMNGIHPVTGMPVRPDPAEAVRTALNVAYYATPSARELEQQRVLQRAQRDGEHRQRLSGVGGSSASVPRTPPPPTSPTDRKTAMIAEVGDMLNGSWTGNN